MTLDIKLAKQIQHLDAKSLEELQLFVSILLQKQNTENGNNEQLLASWDWEKFPKDLSAYAILEKDLNALTEVFEGEPSAEELCKMLNA